MCVWVYIWLRALSRARVIVNRNSLPACACMFVYVQIHECTCVCVYMRDPLLIFSLGYCKRTAPGAAARERGKKKVKRNSSNLTRASYISPPHAYAHNVYIYTHNKSDNRIITAMAGRSGYGKTPLLSSAWRQGVPPPLAQSRPSSAFASSSSAASSSSSSSSRESLSRLGGQRRLSPAARAADAKRARERVQQRGEHIPREE